MFVRLNNSDHDSGRLPFCANIYLIETITINEKRGKIKLFYPSGKEWIADIRYLDDLLKFKDR